MGAAPGDVPDILVTTYLEMRSSEQFVPAFMTDFHDTIVQVVAPDVEYYRFLYRSVGYHLRWRDRLLMPDAQLSAALIDPATSIFILYVAHVPAGYVELERVGQSTEIAYFGLRPPYYGRGLGKHLLSFGIRRAWDDGAARVWVHTCNLDGAYALDNYLKRGFEVYRVDEEAMPERYRA